MGTPGIVSAMMTVLLTVWVLVSLTVLATVWNDEQAFATGAGEGTSAQSSKLTGGPPRRRSRGGRPPRGPRDRKKAWDLLFRRETIEEVKKWLTKLGVLDVNVPDLAQTVMIEAVKSFPTYDPERSPPERWLNKITLHVALQEAEKARRRREELIDFNEEELAIPDERPLAPDLLLVEERRLFLIDTLQKVPADIRFVLIARDIEEIPMTEVAERLGMPLSTAYKWRARAFARAKEIAVEHRTLEDNWRLKQPKAERNPEKRICVYCGRPEAERWSGVDMWTIQGREMIHIGVQYAHRQCDPEHRWFDLSPEDLVKCW